MIEKVEIDKKSFNRIKEMLMSTDEEDVNLGTPEVICSNGLTQEGCLDFGFEITDRKKMAINRMAEEEDVKRLNKEA